jgi:hypothetical protein
VTLTFLGDLVRYEIQGNVPDEAGTLYEQHSIEAFNGTVRKSLFNKVGEKRFPTGFIESATDGNPVTIINSLPVLWAFGRIPATHTAALDPSEWTVTPGAADQESEGLLLLEEIGAQGQSRTRTIQVDSRRDYLPTRIQTFRSGNLSMQFDIEFRKDEAYNWIPDHWRITKVRADGSLRTSIVGQVLEYQINPSVDARDFDLVFPADSLVTDASRQPPEAYLQRSDGSRRVITSAESDAGYDKWLSTDSGQAVPGPRASSSFLLMCISGAMLLLILAYLLRRRAAYVP